MEESTAMGNGSKGRKSMPIGDRGRDTSNPQWKARPASPSDTAKPNGLTSDRINKDADYRRPNTNGGTVLPTWYHYGRIVVYAIGLTIVLFVWLMYGR